MQTWKTLAKRTLLTHSKFLRVEEHTVELPDGRVIPDWPWLVTPDFVNVLPETDAGKFLCFRQTKYAFEGISLATVGGYLEPGEMPADAAARELKEEMGCVAREWVALGQFVVDANRGAGLASLYLARGAQTVAEPVRDDLEEQELVSLTRSEIATALLAGEFKNLSWATTVALALARLNA